MRLLTSCILLLLFAACQTNDIAHQSDFEKSFKVWQKFKAEHDNSYTYTVTSGSWVGFGVETDITVTNGKVTKRKFSYTGINSVLKPEGGWDAASIVKVLAELKITESEFKESRGKSISSFLQWEESMANLGQNEESPAAAPITLDEIYDKAQNMWLAKRENANIYFEAKNNGLISSCGYIDKNCADDCFVGVNVSRIEPVSK